MTNPVLVISDTHYHNFKQYAQLTTKGVNTRLGDILRATVEAAMELRKRGGKTIVHCGDVFHVRGSLAPSVLNPVVDMYKRLIDEGFEVHMISGNHDLETDGAARLSSSVSALESVGVKVYNQPTEVRIGDNYWHFIPWIKDLKDLRTKFRGDRCKYLVIHAPLNGVITGIPDHGLTSKDFAGSGYKRVFCGHYHNHRRFEEPDVEVYSVGALTHQNWGDVDSTAGYIIVDDKLVHQQSTSAPRFKKVKFIDLNDFEDSFYADNYIKVIEGGFTDPSEIQEVKDELLLRGAKAVVVEGLVKRPAASRGILKPSTSAPTVESVLGDYLDRTYPGDALVKARALEIMRTVTE